MTRLTGEPDAVLLNHRGCLRGLPSEETRREGNYRGNDYRGKGSFFHVIIGIGIKKLQRLGEPFSGRMTLRVVLFCRLFG